MSRYLSPPLDRIVVEPIVETVTKGGILVPKEDRDNPKMKRRMPTMLGKVLAVGPGPRRDDGAHCEMGVEVGDVVAYHCAVEVPVTLDGVEYIVIDESALIAIVKDRGNCEAERPFDPF